MANKEYNMTGTEVGVVTAIVTGALGLTGWLNNKIEKRHEANSKHLDLLERNLMTNYMTKDETMKMYALMNESSDLRLKNVEVAVKELRDTNAEQFRQIFIKLDELK